MNPDVALLVVTVAAIVLALIERIRRKAHEASDAYHRELCEALERRNIGLHRLLATVEEEARVAKSGRARAERDLDVACRVNRASSPPDPKPRLDLLVDS